MFVARQSVITLYQMEGLGIAENVLMEKFRRSLQTEGASSELAGISGFKLDDPLGPRSRRVHISREDGGSDRQFAICEVLLPACRQSAAHPFSVGYGQFQHAPELSYIHVTLAACGHKGAIVLEIPAPLNYLVIGPGRRILEHLLVRYPVHVGAQGLAGLLGEFTHKRLLFEVPDGLFGTTENWLLHKAYIVSISCPVRQPTSGKKIRPYCGYPKGARTAPACVQWRACSTESSNHLPL